MSNEALGRGYCRYDKASASRLCGSNAGTENGYIDCWSVSGRRNLLMHRTWSAISNAMDDAQRADQ
jgi:hypothetical protein